MIDKIESIIKNTLPSPFSIAIILTILIVVLSTLLTDNSFIDTLNYWEKGLWNPPLMNFAMQMMLMLVLGYVIALSRSFQKITNLITKFCNNTSQAAALVAFTTIIVSFFNWGLGLVFGAILARKVGEHSLKNNINLNYPLIGAAGYSGLMVWHGGISGSIPLKIAEKNHFSEIITNPKLLENLPFSGINFSETVFSSMNIFTSLILIIIVPTSLFYIGKLKPNGAKIKFEKSQKKKTNEVIVGAEKIDYSFYFSKIVGLVILLIAIRKAIFAESLSFINPNFVNLSLFGIAIILHDHFNSFLNSVQEAISSASGILIQFPLYFGIMGVMTKSGLVNIFADFFVTISNQTTYPIFTMLSGGLVNIFVPSGGGQWAVQGIIVLQSAVDLNLPIAKSIMALVYGDQLTNMLQPFWALPLLGITQLKAKEILPYSLVLFCIGLIIFTASLLIF
tara:strand:+ start:7131 stop:8480 length:1350 start_codon:yes stop_codon:yes gene_type:complete